MLALPTVEILSFIMQCNQRVVDCGAGNGLWLRIMREFGIDAIGIDPYPRGPDVIIGSHLDLSRYTDRLLLIVWPPDGTDVQEWIDVWDGEWLAICGCFERFFPPKIDKHWSITLPAIKKSRSHFVLGRNPKYQSGEE